MRGKPFIKGHIPLNKKEIEWHEDNGCWICTSHHADSSGYPIGSNGRLHRIMYEKYKGKIENGLFVCHKCDNPTCINPEHLFLGTNADNFNDMRNKNRHSKGLKHGIKLRGEKNGFHKLTEKEAIEIKYGYQEVPYKNIALKYGVCNSTIGAIKRNINWKYLKGDASCQ